MKYCIALLTALLISFNARAAFIEGLEDVPLMEGLNQLQSDNISFGNEESRFVEAILSSESKSFNEVQKFYQNTLPQMGWIYQGKRGPTMVFEREGEVIDITPESLKPLRVRLTVKSKI